MKDTEKPKLSPCENISAPYHPRLPTLQQYEEDNNNINLSGTKGNFSDHHVRKSGIICVKTNGQKKIAARAKVYTNRLDHYIVLSARSITNSNQKFINLKHTHVEQEGDNCIRVTPTKDVDGQSLSIIISNKKDVQSWLEALTPVSITSPTLCHRTPLMPTLQESDEE